MKESRLEEAITKLLEEKPFDTNQKDKEALYSSLMPAIHQHHLSECEAYCHIWHHLGHVEGRQKKDIQNFWNFAPLPVGLFKKYLLSSISQDEIYKILASSGTTGNSPSRVPLNRQTAEFQQKALTKIMASFLGEKRMPMLIIDSEQIMKNHSQYSARAAGILGFSIYGSRKCFALDEDLKLDVEKVRAFLEKYQGKPILVFGFTYLVWQTLYGQLKDTGIKLDLSNGILIHGGGWKRLKDQAVSEERFREGLHETCGLQRVSNYYGMAEQTGGIYIECEEHHFHISLYSELMIRNLQDFSLCQPGEEGVIQVMTPLAMSFPGHNLLTEDKGILLGEDDCPCGRKGKYFKLTGRMKRAEIRGCSDVYADETVAGKS